MSLGIFAAKSYVDATKFRAVLLRYFDPRARALAERELFIKNGGSSEDAEIMFPDPPSKCDKELVNEAIQWVFNPGRSIQGQRFNDESFPAIYTAKEPQTAAAELGYWVGAGHEVVIFEILFSGSAIDLRPQIDSGAYNLPLAHDECQVLGAEARKVAESIAAYSMRRKRGNCCAIFFSHSIKAGAITFRGII